MKNHIVALDVEQRTQKGESSIYVGYVGPGSLIRPYGEYFYVESRVHGDRPVSVRLSRQEMMELHATMARILGMGNPNAVPLEDIKVYVTIDSPIEQPITLDGEINFGFVE
jgi:hypothetical protein